MLTTIGAHTQSDCSCYAVSAIHPSSQPASLICFNHLAAHLPECAVSGKNTVRPSGTDAPLLTVITAGERARARAQWLTQVHGRTGHQAVSPDLAILILTIFLQNAIKKVFNASAAAEVCAARGD
jgi:hypothetical protein